MIKRRMLFRLTFVFSSCLIIESCYNCVKSYEDVKPIQLSGFIIGKDSIRNHAVPTIEIKENDGEIIYWGLDGLNGFWDALKINDSIYKAKNSLAFQIIKKDTTLTFYPVCGCCDTLK